MRSRQVIPGGSLVLNCGALSCRLELDRAIRIGNVIEKPIDQGGGKRREIGLYFWGF